MSQMKSKGQKELRLLRNADILRRMRSGDPLNAVDSRASWFPPRPIIKKDLVEMARLYEGSAAGPRVRWSEKNLRPVESIGDEQGPVTEAG